MNVENMIIDFDDFKTIPKSVKRYILENKKDFIDESQKNPLDRYSMLKSYNDHIIDKHFNMFRLLLYNVKVKAAHYTRVYDIHQLDNGLKVLNVFEHYSRIKSVITEEISKAELKEFENYMSNVDKGLPGKRSGRLSFYYPVSQGERCMYHAGVIGGEVIEMGKQKYPEIYSRLQAMGISVRVIATIPFIYMINNSQLNIINNCILKLLYNDEYNKDYTYQNGYEIIVERNIESKLISEVEIVE